MSRREAVAAKAIDALDAELRQLLPDEPIFDRVEIRGEINGDIFALVPLELISNEHVAVDREHVAELVENMQTIDVDKGTPIGQIEPITLGHIPGVDQFLIVDGFHREAAVRESGEDKVLARLRINSSLEAIRDLRILTAKDHRTVEFSRVIDWVVQAWEDTPWVDKISADQAFALALSSARNPGVNLGLKPGEVNLINDWTKKKSEQWQLPLARIHVELLTARDAAPDLVRQARASEAGKESETITPAQLKRIVQALPGPERYEHQRFVAQYLRDNPLTDSELVELIWALAPLDDLEEVMEVALSESWRPQKKKTSYGVTRRPFPARTGSESSAKSATSKSAVVPPALSVSTEGQELRIIIPDPNILVGEGEFGIRLKNIAQRLGGLSGEEVIWITTDSNADAASSRIEEVHLFAHGRLLIDSGKAEVIVDGEEVDLTNLEFRVLEHLANKKGRVVSREQLLQHCWGDADYYPGGSRTVDVHVGQTRKKLGELSWVIRTRHSMGYVFDDEKPPKR